MMKTISASVAKAKLSSLLAQVEHTHAQFIIERHGKPVAILARPEDVRIQDASSSAEPAPRGALALVGAWRDVPDEVIDEMIAEIYRLRETDKPRDVNLES